MVEISQNQQIMLIAGILLIILVLASIANIFGRNLIEVILEWIEYRRNNPWFPFPPGKEPPSSPLIPIVNCSRGIGKNCPISI